MHQPRSSGLVLGLHCREDAASAGDWPAARAEQDHLANLFEIAFTPDSNRVSGGASGLGSFKTALVLLGVIEANTMSVPMASLNDGESQAIAAILRRAGLL